MNHRRAFVIGSGLLFFADGALNITSAFTGLANTPWLQAVHSFSMGVAIAWVVAAYALLRATDRW